MARELSLRVVGVAHPNKDGGNRRTEIMFCDPGEFVELRLEPRNKADSNAVAVYSARGFQIGYLSADRAPWISAQMRQGRDVHAVFQEGASYGAVIRIAFDGVKPTLPKRRSASADDTTAVAKDGEEWPDGVDWIPPDE